MILPRYLLALQSVDQFVFDPRRTYRLRGQHQQEPITTLQRRADLVVPLLSAADICFAHKALDVVFRQDAFQTRNEPGVLAGMRNENFSGCGFWLPGHLGPGLKVRQFACPSYQGFDTGRIEGNPVSREHLLSGGL